MLIPSYVEKLMLAEPPIGTPTASCSSDPKLKLNVAAVAVLTVMGNVPFDVVEPMVAVKGMVRLPAASELAACK